VKVYELLVLLRVGVAEEYLLYFGDWTSSGKSEAHFEIFGVANAHTHRKIGNQQYALQAGEATLHLPNAQHWIFEFGEKILVETGSTWGRCSRGWHSGGGSRLFFDILQRKTELTTQATYERDFTTRLIWRDWNRSGRGATNACLERSKDADQGEVALKFENYRVYTTIF
jgi:hypothetical protein